MVPPRSRPTLTTAARPAASQAAAAARAVSAGYAAFAGSPAWSPWVASAATPASATAASAPGQAGSLRLRSPVVASAAIMVSTTTTATRASSPRGRNSKWSRAAGHVWLNACALSTSVARITPATTNSPARISRAAKRATRPLAASSAMPQASASGAISAAPSWVARNVVGTKPRR